MPSGNTSQLSLVIKAVDEATAPLRAISDTISKVTGALKPISNSFKSLFDASGAEKIGGALKGVGEAASGVGKEAFALATKLAAMGAAAGYTFYSVVRGAVDAGDKLSEMAQRTGLGVDAFSSLGFAMAQSNVDAEQFNSAMDQFNKRLGEAKAGGGPLLDFLKKVSPVLADQIKHVKSTEEGLSLMTDAFARIPDTQRRAALSAEAFGKSGLQVGEALHQGSAAIQKYQARALELTGSQKKFADESSNLDNVLREMSTAFDGAKNAAITGLYPAITALSTTVTDFIVKNRDGLVTWANETGAAIKGWVDGGGIQRLIASVKDIAKTISETVASIGGWKTVLIGVGLVMAGPLLLAVAGLAGSIVTLGAALLATPVGWVVLGLTAIGAGLVALWKNSEDFRAVVGPAFNDMKFAVGALWDTTEGFRSSLLDMARLVGPDLTSVFKVLGSVALFSLTMIADSITSIITLATVMVDTFKDVERYAKAFGVLGALNPVAGVIDSIQTLSSGTNSQRSAIATQIPGITSPGGSDSSSRPEALSSFAPDRPVAGADAATRPGLFSSEPAKVQVDFTNAPKGTRVTQTSGPVDVDLSVGISNGGI